MKKEILDITKKLEEELNIDFKLKNEETIDLPIMKDILKIIYNKVKQDYDIHKFRISIDSFKTFESISIVKNQDLNKFVCLIKDNNVTKKNIIKILNKEVDNIDIEMEKIFKNKV